MAARKERVVVFGAGAAGQRACRFLRHRCHVLAFVDNDPKKHGTKVFGRRVIGPADLAGLPIDRIYIASMHTRQISAQLLNERAIDPVTVTVVPRAIILGEYEVSRWTYVALGVLALAVVGLLAGIGWAIGRAP